MAKVNRTNKNWKKFLGLLTPAGGNNIRCLGGRGETGWPFDLGRSASARLYWIPRHARRVSVPQGKRANAPVSCGNFSRFCGIPSGDCLRLGMKLPPGAASKAGHLPHVPPITDSWLVSVPYMTIKLKTIRNLNCLYIIHVFICKILYHRTLL